MYRAATLRETRDARDIAPSRFAPVAAIAITQNEPMGRRDYPHKTRGAGGDAQRLSWHYPIPSQQQPPASCREHWPAATGRGTGSTAMDGCVQLPIAQCRQRARPDASPAPVSSIYSPIKILNFSKSSLIKIIALGGHSTCHVRIILLRGQRDETLVASST